MATQTDRGVPLSTLCPKFLHTNSTSHTWPFSAIAELIDNAYDPDVSAKQFWIDKTVVRGQECLIFMDNGNGLDNEAMHKMLSFGYSDKTAVNRHRPIGMYGNGFKSGSMRLGRDTIVFSKSKDSSCVGMLSQTYLETIGVNQIIVPIVCFERRETNELTVKEEHKTSLQDILRYSPFKTREELLTEIDAITSTWSTEETGTRIIIWNLRSTSTRTTEFDFETDRYDIRIPSDVYEAMNDTSQQTGVTSHIPASVYSLRAYCSILYLKPRMQINIRGQKVKSELIAKSLAHVKRDYYSPNFQSKRVPITFGYNTKSKEQYGVMMYHKNRLIKAYERLGCQLRANNKGVGVIGIIECDYLEPTHNKQSFSETDKYRKTIHNLGVKLEEYWQQIRFEKKKENPNSIPVEDDVKRPDQNWVQCDNSKCLKWRKLPDGIDCNKLPDKWYCHMNPDPQFRNCQAEEEPVDSDDDTRSSYRKTYKQHEKEAKNQEKKRQKEEEEQRLRSDQHNADLTRRKAAAKLPQNPAFSPSTPTTPRTRFNTESSERGAAVAESFTVSQTACSPSSNNGLPVITDVRSLSAVRGKRTHPSTTPQRTPKRLKMNLFPQASAPCTPVGPQSSPSVSINNNDTDDTDDDVHILESESTPKPKKSEFSLTKVKMEQEESDTEGKESSKSLNFAVDANVFETGSSTTDPLSPVMTSTTTQTEMPKVKMETESQNQTDEEGRAGCSHEAQTSNENIRNCFEQQVIKQESSEQPEDEIQDGKDEAGPPGADVHSRRDPPLNLPSMIEVQEQQDQLLELMQTTAQERDAFKEQVRIVTSHLEDTQSKLQKLSQINEKKVCYPQTTQTEAEKDYKSLFEKFRQKINELIKDKEALPAAAEMESSSAQDEEKDIDQIVLKVERLRQRLDQRNQEKDELHLQLNSLETERANLALQCEELKMNLQQQRENAQERSTTPQRCDDSSVEREPEVAEETATEEASRSLIELRHNVGRLLVFFMPALELDQVNYECSVIDEILEQFLSEGESVGPLVTNR